ncbi:MAG: ABC transporter substrate-binding protein [Clostridiales bacterium]|nr:ABC transporter substrate-binding protein [Clostridiales bacterium]
MKKGFKNVLALALSSFMVLGTAACGSSSSESGETSQETDKTQIGIVQMADNGAFTDMREGFIAEMNEKGYDNSNTEFIYKNAQGDASNLNTICQQMVSDGVDLVAAIATPSAQAMVNMKSDIPVVFISVSSPLSAGVVTDMEKPDLNATGTSNPIPVEEIIEFSKKVDTDVKKYGILYTSGEVNSVNTADKAKEYITSNGMEYVETVVTNSSEVQQAAQQLCSECDAVFVPNDSVIQSAMPVVAAAAKDAGVPVYGSSAVMVNEGAFATIAISDTEIGAISADMAVEILNGKSVADIPVLEVPGTEIVVNKTTMEALGIEIDDSQGVTFVE